MPTAAELQSELEAVQPPITIGQLRDEIPGPTTIGALRDQIPVEQPSPELQPFPEAPPEALKIAGTGRIATKVEEALQLDEPLGPSEEFLQPLRDIGLLAKSREDVTLPRTFNEVVIRGTGTALDIVGRGLHAIIVGGAAVLGDVGRGLGVIETNTEQKKFERDIELLVDTALILTLSNPSAFFSPRQSPRARKRMGEEAERMIERSFPNAGVVAKEKLKERVVEGVLKTTDDALLEQAKVKIGQKTFGETKEAARFSFTDKVFTDTLDALAPIKKIAEQEAKVLGEAPDLIPYREMRLVAGLDGVIESVFKRGSLRLTEQGDVVFRGKSFNEVFKPVADDLENVNLYFAGRRARELVGRKIETPFSADEIAAMVNLEKRNPALKQAFDDYQQFNRETLDFAQQAGVISAETKKRFLDAGQSYVPFYRLIQDEAGNIKANVKGSPLRRLKGGKAPLNEIIDNITRNTVMWYDLAVKNRAKAQVYEMIERFGLDDVAVRVPSGPRAGFVADKKIEAALVDLGFTKPGEAVQVFTAPRIIGDNIDSVYINGKRVLFEIKDPVFLKAMNAFTPNAFGLGMRIISGFSNVLRRGVTLSPDFMARNLLRDTQTAFVQTQGNYLPVVDALRGIMSRIAKDENYWEMLANGGGFATLYRGETTNIGNLQKIYAKHGINPSRVLDTPRKIADGLEEISSAFEQASRISEFRGVRAAGQSRREAAFSSRDVSTDFALRGASPEIRALAASIPFLNARAQGLSKMVKTARANPAKLALRATTAMTVPAVALYMINKDDDRYKALPNWVRDLHFVFFVPGSDDPYLVPKGFEYGALFATVPERIMEAIERKERTAFANAMGRMFLDTFSFNPIPQAVKPIAEAGVPFLEFAGFNRRFTGAPVVPKDLQDVRLSEQFRPWTSDTMVELAAAMRAETGIEISPMKAEALVVGYLGTLGLYALNASDALVRTATGKASPEVRIDDVPLLRSFRRTQPLRGTQFETDFYDLLAESRMVAVTLSKMIKEGRNPDLTEKERRVMALRPAVENVAKVAAEISRAMRLIQTDPKLSPAEKRKRLDNLQDQRNRFFLQFAREIPSEFQRERGFATPSGKP